MFADGAPYSAFASLSFLLDIKVISFTMRPCSIFHAHSLETPALLIAAFAEPAVIVRTSASVAALTAFNANHQSAIVDSTSERSNAKAAVGGKEEAGAANDAAFWLLRFPRLGPLFDTWTRVGSLPSGEQAKLLELLHSASAAAPDAPSSAAAASSSSAAAAAESVQFFGKMVVDTLESIKSFPSQQYVPCHLRHA